MKRVLCLLSVVALSMAVAVPLASGQNNVTNGNGKAATAFFTQGEGDDLVTGRVMIGDAGPTGIHGERVEIHVWEGGLMDAPPPEGPWLCKDIIDLHPSDFHWSMHRAWVDVVGETCGPTTLDMVRTEKFQNGHFNFWLWGDDCGQESGYHLVVASKLAHGEATGSIGYLGEAGIFRIQFFHQTVLQQRCF